MTDDPGVKEALGFLMTREIAHQRSFEKALYSISPNFPPGKLPGKPEFASVYYNMSQGEGDMRGPWNDSKLFQYESARERQCAVDGGDGQASVGLTPDEERDCEAMRTRTASDPLSEPVTGVELGSGPTPVDASNAAMDKSQP